MTTRGRASGPVPDAPLPSRGRLLAIDWGEVRIGLAVTDETQLIASPLETLVRRRGKRFPMPRFLELIEELEPAGLLVGLPLDSDGREGESATRARELAGLVRERTGLPVALVDERMTTARALAAVKEQGGSVRGRKQDVDSLAASLLLQHYLESRRPAE